MLHDKIAFASAGELKQKGYPGKINDLVINEQFLDEKLWELTVNQFRIHPDGDNNGWRCEFWGKLMRAASLSYRATKSAKLYDAITKSVLDMLTAQDDCGRWSTYDFSKEFNGWDMWGRKYVMLGFIYYLEICKNAALRKKIIRALKLHADYIIKKVGAGKGKKDICVTSGVYGGMNSCSILEPFVKLYNLTLNKKYLDFAKYIVDTGFSKDFNVYEACLNKTAYPYEFKYPKAYEMTSCFEGLLEYYKIVGDENYLTAVKNFADAVVETDYTLIGCSGCTHELFDHSSIKQTDFSQGVMQETCVTVTFMKLCAKLYALTAEAKYIDIIEQSGYNALFGAVNTEKQTMKRAVGVVWKGDDAIPTPHESYPFDSYSPLVSGQRAKKVAGFMLMQDGKTYGCCASIGGAGTAIFSLAGVVKTQNGVAVNIYNDCDYKTLFADKKFALSVKANVYGKPTAKITIKADCVKTSVSLRVPKWAEDLKITLDGKEITADAKDGYVTLDYEWNNNVIILTYKTPVKAVRLNGKIAFTRGPVTLCRDQRFGEDLTLPIAVKTKKDGTIPSAKIVKNGIFNSNIAVSIKTVDGNAITLCDYSQAGKNYDNENCTVSVWNDERR